MTEKRQARRGSMVRIGVAGAVAVSLVAVGATLAIAESGGSGRKHIGDTGPKFAGVDTKGRVAVATAPSNRFRIPTGKFRAATADGVTGSYIVVLKDDKATAGQVTASADGLTRTHRGKVDKVYANSLRGFATSMSEADAQQLSLDPAVDYVEQNRLLSASDVQTTKPSPLDEFNMWGLDRIDQPFLPADHHYTHPGTVGDVHVYVLDTGVDFNHDEFSGIPPEQKTGWSTSNWTDAQKKQCATVAPGADDNGHGTFVASEIVGKHFGVAKNAPIESVKVLGCDGRGTTAGVIEGINHVAQTAVKPAVANMSLGNEVIASAIDEAVSAAIAGGVTFVIAAGNRGSDACGASPGRVPEAITVGATDLTDFRADFSNYGSCVDIFAPGVSIVGAGLKADTPYRYMSGTSMATPLVAGDAALLLHAHPDWSPAQVQAAVVRAGISGTVHNAGNGSPTRLLRVGEPASPTATDTIFGLRARANNLIVTAEADGGRPMIASSYNVFGAWERLRIVPAGDGEHVALWSGAGGGRYVAAESAGDAPLIANRTAIGPWELFTLVPNADGSFALLAAINNRYVAAENGGGSALIANRTAIGPWESFELTGPAASVYIVAGANQRAVTAPSAGAAPLVASQTAVAAWESFDVVDAGGGFAGFVAHANGRFVTAENAGDLPLIANRSQMGAWERFSFVNYGVAWGIRANANGRFVTAANGGAAPLIAGRDTVGGASELFILVTLDEL